MPNYERKLEGVTVVLLGSFNPGIIQPWWLAAHSLLRPEEAKQAKVNVIHSEFSQFRTDWLLTQVTTDRFQVSSSDQSSWPALRDLVVGIFQILEHTPISSMGINRDTHFQLPSQELLNNLLSSMVVQEKWPATLRNPELTRLSFKAQQVREVKAPLKGTINVIIEPSIRAQVSNGLYVHVNNHFDGPGEEKEKKPLDNSKNLLPIIKESWDDYLSLCKEVGDNIIGASR